MGGNNRGYGTESLPNVIGRATSVLGHMEMGFPTGTGAFTYTNQINWAYSSFSRSGNGRGGYWDFNAHNSNAVYQDGAKVKPNTLYSNMIIKY